jgi:hypothetical protein
VVSLFVFIKLINEHRDVVRHGPNLRQCTTSTMG